MGQLWVGHSVYRVVGQDIGPLFLRQNGVSLSVRRLSGKMAKCGKIFERYAGPVSPYGLFFRFSESDGLIWSCLSYQQKNHNESIRQAQDRLAGFFDGPLSVCFTTSCTFPIPREDRSQYRCQSSQIPFACLSQTKQKRYPHTPSFCLSRRPDGGGNPSASPP